MSGEFVQKNSAAGADADVGCVTLDCFGLFHNDQIKSGISLMKGISQLGRIIMTRARPPDITAIEGKDALLCVTFDGVSLRVKPGSGRHDSGLLFGECACKDVMMIIIGGCCPSSLFLEGDLVYNIYISRRIEKYARVDR